jgi:AraC family transcriptional regulator
MSAVIKTLWVIESRFQEEMSLDRLAKMVGLSRFYLSRIFPLETGYSIAAYIRGRRLTEAAKVLAAGAPDILSVALEAGYSSHEAFTRAFRDQFGMTPEAVRKQRSLETLNLVEPLKMESVLTQPVEDPRIEHRHPMRLAGILRRHPMSNPARLPGQWQEFQRHLGNIDGQIGRAAYGVVDTSTADEGDFDYLCGAEVTKSATPPPELQVMDIPARTYAIFSHKGHVTSLRSTIGAAYGDWLPRSGRQAAEDASFIEYYGPGFDPDSGTGDIEIWVPVKAQ